MKNAVTALLVMQRPERKNLEIVNSMLTGINEVLSPGVGHISILSVKSTSVMTSNLVDMKNSKDAFNVAKYASDLFEEWAVATYNHIHEE
jgi:LytS/YehU family sensor histidine kinase